MSAIDFDDVRTVIEELGRSTQPSRTAIAAAARLRAAIEPSLFDQPLSDPGEDRPGAVHARGGETEARAAWEAMPNSGTLRLAVLEVIAAAGDYGATDQEVEDRLGLRRPTGGNRRGELMKGGWVRDSGHRRPTVSGKAAIVWVLTDRARQQLAASDRRSA